MYVKVVKAAGARRLATSVLGMAVIVISQVAATTPDIAAPQRDVAQSYSDVDRGIATLPPKLQPYATSLMANQNQFEKQFEAASPTERDTALNVVKAGLDQGVLKAHLLSGEVLDQAKSTLHTKKDNGYQVLSIPVCGGDLVRPSSLTVEIAPDGALGSYSEQHYSARPGNQAHVFAWTDGELKLNATADAEGNVTTSAEGLPQTNNHASTRSFFGSLNQCLSSAGIPQAVIGLIGVTCAVACVVTVGAGCVACIAALAGGSGGLIGGCIAWASKQ